MEYLDPEKYPDRYGLEGISYLASLEVRFQTQMWGEVEDSMALLCFCLIIAHDVDYADVRRQLGSATTLLHR